MLSRQGGLNLEIKCPCARKTRHEREVGIFLKWAYFRETTVLPFLQMVSFLRAGHIIINKLVIIIYIYRNIMIIIV